jgi:acetoin utilization deacetylase AcuC-like enzyme
MTVKLVWSPHYEVDLFGHVFPVRKYGLLRERLLEEGLIEEGDLVEAEPADQSDLRLVHTAEYLDDLMNLRRTHRTMRSELALTREIVDSYVVAAGGSTTAARLAPSDGASVHLGGGFHHAFPGHAEGFCYVNDVAVAAAGMLRDGGVERVCIIDCDVHQGNGTAFTFAREPAVFTFSIHQERNYPVKERSDLDIGLPDGAGDRLYLEELAVVSGVLDRHRPDLAFYLAGADPYRGDLLGGLALTMEGLARRDNLVFSECRSRSVPVCTVLAGGYAQEVSDVVEIHRRTVAEALSTFA